MDNTINKNEVLLAKKGVYKLLLTPNKEVPKEWIGDVKNKRFYALHLVVGNKALYFQHWEQM